MKQFLNKNKEAFGGVVIIIVAFYCGRYSAPERIKTETKIVEVEKEVIKTEYKTVRIKENKDGSKETIIVSESNSQEKAKQKSSEEKKEIVKNGSTYVSVLLGGASTVPHLNYGLSVQRDVLGPFTIGVWGLTNYNFGASVGLRF